MALTPTQAGIRSALLALVFPCLLLSGAAAAATGATFGAKEQKVKEKPKEDKVLSLGDLLQSAEDLLPGIAPKDAPDVSLPPLAKDEEKKAEEKKSGEKNTEDKTKETKAPSDIPVHKMKEPAEAKDKTPPQPYRIYPSPYVPGDASAYDRPPVRPEAERPASPPLTGPAAAPVTGMIRKFFPVLPLGAPKDMPPQFLPLATSMDLGADHSDVARAVVFVHDLTRDASDGLAMLTMLAGTENATTLILAPQFPLEADITRFMTYLPNQGQDVARWAATRDGGWQTGEDSLARPPQKGISSFTAMDLVLLYLSDRRLFPALQQITVAGHGMGADFVQRYAAVGRAPILLAAQGVPVRFLAANPSSYLYFTRVRPGAAGFGMPDVAKCPGVNDYPYGLAKLPPYARSRGADAIRLGYPERRVMVLLSEKIAADPYLDTNCAATVQGLDRLTRGRNYERYLSMSFGDAAGATQKFVVVPSASYDPVALFGSYCGLAFLFGDGECKPGAKPRQETRPRY